ncbi:hypothetical protein NEFER03_1389 [Nematocida sp. LUAm3]|nr:hypothetical protein NEFER03_1389 [Nematocida sp. LUAm3]KAI5174781.1 hypothetical protein NEFER02_0891 [Nematocida sp. LUAm2]KAI5177808.1 hypothetical protein NEFER01_1010 [Nematocida sp. LUAm1]
MLRYYTVEYDGFTYKKEEKKEKQEEVSGSKYLLEYLSGRNKNPEEIKKVIFKVNTRSRWKDLSEKQEKLYMKMEKILQKLRGYTPFSAPFLNKVNKREAPDYYILIKNPMDLGKIGKKISQQEYTEISEFAEDLDLIWKNCFQFNNDYGNIYAMYAQKMKEKSLLLLQELYIEKEIEINEPEEALHHFISTEKQRKELVATRSAVLQAPQEFTHKRSPEKMGEFWKKEIASAALTIECTLPESMEKIIEISVPSKSSSCLLEYNYFYDAFPVVYEEKEEEVNYMLDEVYSNQYSASENPALASFSKLRENPLIYRNRRFFKEEKELPHLSIGKQEALLLLKKIIAAQLITIGFSSVETSALNLLVSYIFNAMGEAARLVVSKCPQAHFSLKNQEKIESIKLAIILLIKKYQIESLEINTESFFSDEEENTSDESILDIIYSDIEEMETLEDIL